MKVYETSDIRNVGLVGHGHSGKTSLAAGLLFTSGATNRLTRVDEGNTITDFDEEEIQRKITISTAVAAAEWNKNKINLIDTPGFNIFINDTTRHAGRRRRRLGAGGRRGRRRSADRKGVGVHRRIPAPARHRHQQTRPRTLQLRPRARKRPAVLRPHRHPDSSAHRLRARIQRRGRPGPHEVLHLHTRRRRQGQGRRDSRRPGRSRAEGATRRWSKWWPKATTRCWRNFSNKGTLPVEHILDGLREAVRAAPHCSGAVRRRPAQCRRAI